MAKHTYLLLITLVLASAPGLAQEPASAFDEAMAKAQYYMNRGQHKEAVKVYRDIRKLKVPPTFEWAIGLATALNHTGSFISGARSADQALELADEPMEQVAAYSQIGIAAYAGGAANAEALQKAEAALRQVVEMAPDSAKGVRFLFGLVLLELGRDEEGVAVLEEYIARNPTGRSVEQARAYIKQPLRARVPMVPDFEISTLDGESLTPEDLEGKVVLFDFWGTWCKPCIQAIPHLRRLNKKAARDPFVIVGIASDDDEDMLRKFLAKHKVSWHQFIDKDRQITHEAFEVSKFPTYLLVNHEGVIIYRRSGWSGKIASDVSSQVSKAIKAAKKAAM